MLYLCHELFMPGWGQVVCQTLAAPGDHAGGDIDINGRLSQAVQQELLIDDVLAVLHKQLLYGNTKHFNVLADLCRRLSQIGVDLQHQDFLSLWTKIPASLILPDLPTGCLLWDQPQPCHVWWLHPTQLQSSRWGCWWQPMEKQCDVFVYALWTFFHFNEMSLKVMWLWPTSFFKFHIYILRWRMPREEQVK